MAMLHKWDTSIFQIHIQDRGGNVTNYNLPQYHQYVLSTAFDATGAAQRPWYQWDESIHNLYYHLCDQFLCPSSSRSRGLGVRVSRNASIFVIRLGFKRRSYPCFLHDSAASGRRGRTSKTLSQKGLDLRPPPKIIPQVWKRDERAISFILYNTQFSDRKPNSLSTCESAHSLDC